MLPRELLIPLALVACQLLYSQVYPVLRPLLPRLAAEAETGGAPPASAPGAPTAREAAAAVGGGGKGDLIGGEELVPVAVAAAREFERGRAENPPAGAAAPPPPPAGLARSWPWKPQELRRRARLKAPPKFRVGDVVRDKVLLFRGVVSGWDSPCEGPAWWRKKRLVVPAWGQEPCYGVLVDLRDASDLADGEEADEAEERRGGGGAAGGGVGGGGGNQRQPKMNFTQYVPEAALEGLTPEGAAGAPVLNPAISQYFRFFDEGRYVPETELIRSYPDDIPGHYADLDAVQTGQSGGPLLRVLNFGGFIAHGSPVPVIRKGMFLVATEGVRGVIFSHSAILVLEHSDQEGTLGVIVNLREKKKRAHLAAGRASVDKMESVLGRLQGQLPTEAGERRASQEQLEGLSRQIQDGKRLLRLAELPGVDLRVGGPVGLQEFPFGPSHILLHAYSEPAELRNASKLALSGSGTLENPDLFYVAAASLDKRTMEKLITKVKEDGGGEAGSGRGHRPPPRVVVFAGSSGWGALQLAGEIRGGLGDGSSWGWIPASPREVLTAKGKDTWRALNASKAIRFLEER